MPKGLPATYIKQARRKLGKGASWSSVFKEAWRIYKKGKIYKAVSAPVRHKKRRRRFKMPRWRRKRRRGGGKSISRTVMKWIRVAGLLAPAGVIATSSMSGEDKFKHFVAWYTGFNPYSQTFEPHQLLKGWGGFIGATVITHLIGKLGGIIRKL